MKRLTKADLSRRDRITDGLREAAKKVEQSYRVLSEAASAHNDQIAAYNEALEEARGFADDMARSIEDFMSEKSERWLEGDRGQAYEEWKSEWSGLELTDLSPIEVLEFDEPEHAATIENASEEPTA